MPRSRSVAPILSAALFAACGSRAAGGPKVSPILFEQGGDQALVVGASNGAKWLSWKQTTAHVKAGDSYRFVTKDGASSVSAIGKPVLSPASGMAYNVQVRRALSGKGDHLGLPSSAKWILTPRKSTSGKPADPEIAKAVSDFLVTKGVASPKVEVATVSRCDLDGDGSIETVIAAMSPGARKDIREASSAKAGQFSIVVLQQADGKSSLIAGEIKTKTSEDDLPPQLYMLNRLVDLNGDGRMEIVIETQYSEGGGIKVFEWDGKRSKKVLDVEDGA